MEVHERRKHARCYEDTDVIYSFINKTANYAAVARNYSRFGMYLESNSSLTPGTIIVIRTMGCSEPGDTDADAPEKPAVSFYCKAAGLRPQPCRDLKSLVTAEVKRCEIIPNSTQPRCGIGVHFVQPAV